MANYTPNLNLRKPLTTEKYDVVADLNDTKNKIDTHAGAVNAQLAEIATNVKSLGAKGDGVTDDTQAIRNALAISKNIYFPPGKYLISVSNTSRGSLKWFTDETDVIIRGNNAVLVDGNTYSTPALTNIFAFTRCKNVEITGINYLGKVIVDPDNQLHNLGTTFAYFEDNCTNIKVEADLENIRYGVRSGDYLNPVYGYCSNFKIYITGKMIGYPVALNLVDNADIKVYVDGVHRAVYLAGVYGANVDCKTKNSYGATIQVLLTNSITIYSAIQSEQRARGCKFIKVNAVDTGSTKHLPHAALTGIALQWVAQGTEYTDIDIHFNVRSSDTVSSQMGGFHLDSTVGGVPFTWENYILFKNIKISGAIDRTGQTVATNQAGEIYIRAYDTKDTGFTHSPKMSNFVIENVVINKGLIQSRGIFIDVPNLQDSLIINNLQADGIDVFMSARTGKVALSNSKIKALAVTSLVNDLQVVNSSVTSFDSTRINRLTTSSVEQAQTKSANIVRQINVPITGAMSYTVPGVLKATSMTKAIVGVLSGYIATGTMKLGTASVPDKYGSAPLNNTNGYTRFSPWHFNQPTFPLYTSEALVITFDSSTPIPSGLTLSLYVYEEEFIVN